MRLYCKECGETVEVSGDGSTVTTDWYLCASGHSLGVEKQENRA